MMTRYWALFRWMGVAMILTSLATRTPDDGLANAGITMLWVGILAPLASGPLARVGGWILDRYEERRHKAFRAQQMQQLEHEIEEGDGRV